MKSSAACRTPGVGRHDFVRKFPANLKNSRVGHTYPIAVIEDYLESWKSPLFRVCLRSF